MSKHNHFAKDLDADVYKRQRRGWRLSLSYCPIVTTATPNASAKSACFIPAFFLAVCIRSPIVMYITSLIAYHKAIKYSR